MSFRRTLSALVTVILPLLSRPAAGDTQPPITPPLKKLPSARTETPPSKPEPSSTKPDTLTKPEAPAAATPARPPVPPGGRPLKKRQASLHGLLVMELDGKFAGQASLMNITALENGRGDEGLVIKFNQEVGGSMLSAAHEAEKHLSVRHNGLPTGWNMELAFEDRYVPKDGPSAALACALLLDSLLSGTDLDKEAAVTGDMNADGSVRPVGGVPDKVRAAGRKRCSVVCIPRKNAEALEEYAVAYGPEILAAAHLFDVATFLDARALVSVPRSEAMERALLSFQDIQRALPLQTNPTAWLRNPKVIERLKSILADAPESFSARALLTIAEGRAPRQLSLRGSFEIVYTQVQPEGNPGKSTETPEARAKRVKESIKRLESIRDRLDPRIRAYASGAIDFLSTPPGRTPSTRLRTELAALRSNKEIMELMLDD